MRRFFQLVLPTFQSSDLRSDVLAGITTGITKLKGAVSSVRVKKQSATKKRSIRRARVPRQRRVAPASDTRLSAIWNELQLCYFPDRNDLQSYSISWSKRSQKRTLACCNSSRRCVRVARELDYPDFELWLAPLLYHEMCHAVLERNVSRSAKGTLWHGPEFKALEKQHPKISALHDWIKAGGWSKAVRSDRAKRAWQNQERRSQQKCVGSLKSRARLKLWRESEYREP